MWRKNFDSVLSRSSEGLDPDKWIRPYGGINAQPALVARYDALGKLPQNTFGKALWDFDKRNGYPFPGDPTALNASFGTPHDSTHVISGYDTSARGELLVSTFTAGMHPINPMSGHILPVIFFFHFGEQHVGHAGKGGLDPDEFWHAWARGAEMTVDIFDPGGTSGTGSSTTSRTSAAVQCVAARAHIAILSAAAAHHVNWKASALRETILLEATGEHGLGVA